MTPELIAFLGQYGLPITMFVVAFAMGARGTWRWGREVVAAEMRADKAEKERDEWKFIALDSLRAGTKVIEVGAKVVEVVANGKP